MITIRNEGNKARIEIVGNISEWHNNSTDFRKILNDLKSKNVNDVDIYINSFGGSVFDANEIANIINEFSGIISFTLGAVCASAATIIVAQVATSRDNVEISQYRNGQYMIHNVSANLDGNISAIESGLELMKNLQQNAINAYVLQTGLSADEITIMMDKETWMTAQQALDKKFITGIINEAARPDNIAEIQNCGYKHLPKLDVINQTQKDMNLELVNKTFGKNFTAETDAIQYFMELQTENNALKQAKIEAEKSAKSNEIESILQKAIEDKKILPAKKELYRKMLNDSFDTAKQLVEGLPKAETLSDKIVGNGTGEVQETYQELAERNPAKLKELFNNDFDTFNKLFKAEYGKDYIK